MSSVRTTGDSKLVDAAVEALGGGGPNEFRPDESPLAATLPPAAANPIEQFDRTVDRWFDRLRGNPIADRVFYGASALGDFSLIWHAVAIGRAVARPSTTAEAARLAAALGIESVAVNVGVKSLFRRDRPTWDQHRPRPLRKPRSSSFPSGHATSGFLAASLLSAGRPKQRPFWFAAASIVALSRVHVRIHHASDVVGGAAIGLFVGRLISRSWSHHKELP
jgi:undecaprenyl-diphosphatase